MSLKIDRTTTSISKENVTSNPTKLSLPQEKCLMRLCALGKDINLNCSMERKEMLGVTPDDKTSKMLRRVVHVYYSMSFRREAGLFQLVGAEYQPVRHVHGGRPRS